MKTFCRILSCLLVVLTLFACVACGSSTTKKENPTTAPTTGTETGNTETGTATNTNTDTATPSGELVKPVIPETFGGDKIRFYINGGAGNASMSNIRSIALVADADGEVPDPDYAVNQLVVTRNQTVEDELKVKIEVAKVGTMQGAVSDLGNILTAQDDVYDVLALYQYFDLGLALGDTVGSFYNLENMPEGVTSYLNVKAPYWSQALYNTLKYNNTAFFVTGDLCQATIGTLFVSFVNSKLWNQYADQIKNMQNSGGYSDIYDIVNNGYWTLDLIEELGATVYADTNDNGKNDYKDRCSFIIYGDKSNCATMDCLVAGFGLRYTTTSADGMPVMAFDSETNTDIYTRLQRFMTHPNTTAVATYEEIVDEAGKSLYIMDVFAQGNVLVTVNTLDKAEYYLQDMTDFWVMPLPMLSRDQYNPNSASKGYATQLGDSVSQYAICKFSGEERLPAITATLELMGYYSKLWITPKYYEALKIRYTRDDKNAAMIDMVREGIYSDFGLVWSRSLNNVSWELRTNYNPAKGIAKYAKLTQNKLNLAMADLLVKIEEAYDIQ